MKCNANMRHVFQSVTAHLLCVAAIVFFGHANAQTAYGISRTQTFVINPTTGVATTPVTSPSGNNFAAQVGYESSAMAVSPLNGLLYIIERTTPVAPILVATPVAGFQVVNRGVVVVVRSMMYSKPFNGLTAIAEDS